MGTTPKETRAQRFDSLEQEAFLNLWRTYDRMRAIEQELFGRYDLTPQQYNALRLLRAARQRRGGKWPGRLATLDLASQLVSRAPDITRLLDPLERRGLIDRDRPADNRRVVCVGITDAGLALLRELGEQVRACHARQFGHLSEKELRDLIALLRAARRPHEETDSTWLDG
jgi:DNA-binding MarR family transcriptional regulator